MHIFLYSKLCYAFASVHDFGTFKNYANIEKKIAIKMSYSIKFRNLNMYSGECVTKNLFLVLLLNL